MQPKNTNMARPARTNPKPINDDPINTVASITFNKPIIILAKDEAASEANTAQNKIMTAKSVAKSERIRALTVIRIGTHNGEPMMISSFFIESIHPTSKNP